MPTRVTGMMSGLDTESLIQELVAVKQTKVDALKKEQTKHEWKQEAWKDLNTKIYDLFKGTMDKLCYQSSYMKKTTTVSNPNAATVITGDSAMKTVQSLKIKSMASSGYMTGGKIAKDGVTTATTMKDLLGEDAFATGDSATINVTVGGKNQEITVTADSKISDFTHQLKAQGLNVNFDSATGRIFVGASAAGVENDFSFGGSNALGNDVLKALGLTQEAGAVKQNGKNAEIELNGATFTSNSNTFEVNGLTITCLEETGDNAITLSTQDDTSGTYDLIKNFIKEYSSLINEMDKLYNADSSKGYDPLTDDEKDTMSESEVEKWEKKIKDSLLRRDSSLSTVSSALKQVMSAGYEVNGKVMYLSDFGIETLGYFNAKDNEKNAYHINGDEDDSDVSTKTNELLAAISTDVNQVMDFFTQLGKNMKSKLDEMMKSTDYRSLYSVYDDKKMKEEYDNYTKEIKEAEQKLLDYEDKWYKKFSAMETAMAKMQSNSNAITSMLGG